MKTIVLGCGRVGAGVAGELVTRGAEVVVVDVDPQAIEALGPGFPGTTVTGSAMDHTTLETSGLPTADAVAVVTGNDDLNAVVALHCRRTLHVPTVVARLYDPRRAEVTQRLGVRTLSPVRWGIQRFADLLLPGDVHTAHTLGTGGVELTEIRVPHLLHDRTASELQVPGESQIVALTRHGRTTLASPATPLEEGDLVHVAVAERAKGRIERLLD